MIAIYYQRIYYGDIRRHLGKFPKIEKMLDSFWKLTAFAIFASQGQVGTFNFAVGVCSKGVQLYTMVCLLHF